MIERGLKSMSYLVQDWASETAPVADTYERIILMKLARHASNDGRSAYPSIPSMARAALCDTETVKRRLKSLLKRKLIGLGDQGVVARIRADKRPKVYDLLVPYEWYSAQQIEQVNREVIEGGRVPLSPANRPPLMPAPARSRRADKGASPRRGLWTTSSGALQEPPTRALSVVSRGLYKSPKSVL